MPHRRDPHSTDRMKQRARALRRESTVPERILWGLLRNRGLAGLKFRRQVPVGPFVTDFLCERHNLVVELDGLTHAGRGEADDNRTAYLASRGLQVVRVTNDQVLADLEQVAIDILRAIGMEHRITPQTAQGSLPSPQPSPGGRGGRSAVGPERLITAQIAQGSLPSPQPSPKGRGGRSAAATDEWSVWLGAVRRPGVDAALRHLYDRLAADVAARSPTCWLSGKCCKFDTYGHKLYVTGLEIAWLIPQLEPPEADRLRTADLPAMDGCPFQVAKLCTVHALRPLGCRIYYCDPTAHDWQSPVYELYLDDLRTLHDREHIPYRYLEWRTGLAEARDVLRAHRDA